MAENCLQNSYFIYNLVGTDSVRLIVLAAEKFDIATV